MELYHLLLITYGYNNNNKKKEILMSDYIVYKRLHERDKCLIFVHEYSSILKSAFKTNAKGASLVAQWLRICLLMQGTRVRALVWEDPTCHGAAGPVSHNC